MKTKTLKTIQIWMLAAILVCGLVNRLTILNNSIIGLKPVSDALIWDRDQMSAYVFFCNYSFLYTFVL